MRATRFKGLDVGMLTNKGKYGLKAAVHLAGLPENEPALVNDIATEQGISKKFLDTILGELRNAGLVRSKKGRGGGYSLAKSPDQITVGEIVRVLDGPIAPIRCASENYYKRCEDCRDEGKCAVHLVMRQVRDAMADILDKKSLADLRAMARDEAPRHEAPPARVLRAASR